MEKSTIDQNQMESANTPAKKNRVFAVLNPVAGTTDAGNAKDLITNYCSEQGWACDIHETKKNEDVRQVVHDALKEGVDFVLAAGGDGTVSEVVGGMVGSEVPLGIIPAGTGNNLARNLAIPMDLQAALTIVGSDHAIQVLDVMQVNQKEYYVLNVSVGLSSLVMRKTKRSEKRRFGFLAYLWHAIGSVLHTDMHLFQVQADDKSLRVRASELMIANCKFMGLQPQIEGVEITPDDGRMDIFIARTQSFRDYLDLIAAFLLRRNSQEDRNLRYFEAHQTIKIKSEFPLPAQADGEVIGTTPIEIKLLPKSLRIIIPCPEPEK